MKLSHVIAKHAYVNAAAMTLKGGERHRGVRHDINGVSKAQQYRKRNGIGGRKTAGSKRQRNQYRVA